MPPDPSRTATAGRVFNDLRGRARRDGRSTDELLVFYVLERFLYRVTQSNYADSLVLKGGLLLAALDARRATRDADLLGLGLGCGA
jgi:Nucleotidyl transferase AbiEii toxin, Type IV TA system